ncbi:MAG: hypothetical protein HY842_05890 [Bacteroidetes bacterium]|nr:hypothetical protein [Bacteroidota bacterium]
MKRSAFFVFLSLFVIAHFATASPAVEISDCRKTVLNTDLGLTTAQIVRTDLESGLWSLPFADGGEQVYLFKDSGMTDILQQDANGQTIFNTMFWRVEEFDGRAFLVLTESPRKSEKLYRVKQTCEGIVLTDVFSQAETLLKYQPFANHIRVNTLKANLIGEWTNVSRATGTFGCLKFKADGTFSVKSGLLNHESGVWEVTPDAQYLLLHLTAAQSGAVTKTIVVKVEQVDGHGLTVAYPQEVSEGKLELVQQTFIQ